MNVPDSWVFQQIGQLYLETKAAQEQNEALREKVRALEEAASTVAEQA